MNAIRLSVETFERWISNGVTLVDFNAPWCKPCRSQESTIKALEKDYHNVAKVASLNIDKHQDIAFSEGIQSIPTIIIYKNGREINRFIGLQNKQALTKALRHAIGRSKPQKLPGRTQPRRKQ
jgi:thioredoxin 1